MPLPSYQFSGAVYSAPTVGTTTFSLTTAGGAAIDFLDPAHIRVFTSTDGDTLVERFRPNQWDFNTARTQIILVVPTIAGEAVVIRRETPIVGPLVDVPDGINLPAQRLRDLNRYNLFVTQEQFEKNTEALAQATAANLAVGIALSTLANQLPYVRYANRAAVPINPGSAISGEVLDSTNMQTFAPLTGRPGGFIGSSSLIVRMRYNVALVTWEWIDYRPADADARYLLKSQLVNSVASTSVADPPTANAVKIANDAAAAAQTTASTASTAAAAAVATANAAAAAAAAAAPLASPEFTGNPRVSQLNGGPLAGLRNRIINGGFRVDQRNAGAVQALTAGAALAYTADRWYGYCTGANVNGQRITVAGAERDPNRYQFTGAVGVTGIGIGQRIEAANCRDLAGQTCRLSVSLANTLLTTVTWQAFHANTNDVFGTLASPTRTLIASGTIGVNATYTRYDVAVPVPAGATTGIEIVFSVAAQVSGTWTIGQVQLELGDRVTPHEQRPCQLEDMLCKRYFQWIPFNLQFQAYSVAELFEAPIAFPVEMRVTPSAAAITADPNTTPQFLNNATNVVQRLTPYSCGATMSSLAVGAVFVVGYRSALSAEL
jgi:hypothetical protein